MEEEMKNKKEFYAMQFEKLGFKKVPTEDGFVMYELTPGRLDTGSKPQATSNKQQATSGKQQAASNKRLDKVK